MAPKPHGKRVRKIGRVRKGGRFNVTRTEFDAVTRLLNERGEIINELRRDLHELALAVHTNTRDHETEFTRIAQLQQELDDLKKKSGR